MRCPKCGNQDDKVLDSRSSREGRAIRRRRECLRCGARFTTYEEIVRDELRVIKRDGRTEEFSRQKLHSGVMRASQKRPVTAAQIDALIDDVIEQLGHRESADVPSQVIGELVMERLKALDQVAYVRFASVYRRFEDVSEFRKAAAEAKKRPQVN